MPFNRVVKDIKDLKIQGAQNISREAVKALYHIVNRSRAHTSSGLMRELEHARKELEHARPTEPALRNALKFVFQDLHKKDLVQLVKDLASNIENVLSYFSESEKRIAEIGARKVRGVVFTHCHSSTVVNILAKAVFEKKRFEVHNTETRPLFQGRKTAEELAALGVRVSHYVDSAARLALKKADVFMFGADAVLSDGRIINKVGTELFLEFAKKYDIPTYCCTMSWKFDPMTIFGTDEPIENRNRDEVWKGAPKRVTIMNPAFEMIDPALVTGIISEYGIFSPGVFVDVVVRQNPWMTR